MPVAVGVRVAVLVGVRVTVADAVEVRVAVDVRVRVAVGVRVGEEVGVRVAVDVGVRVAVDVRVTVTVGVRVAVAVGVRVRVTVGVRVGVLVIVDVDVGGAVVGVGGPGEPNSKAPISHRPARRKFRWSVIRRIPFSSKQPAGLPAFLAGLVDSKAWVWVPPPLACNTSRSGLTPSKLPVRSPEIVQPAMFPMRL
jgi:hypothetical protein